MVATFRRQAGDTIVEVLIAMVVISTVLAGAFVVSRTSLTNVRNSEEHSQALKILQGQFEQLRANIATVPGTDFCFDQTGTVATAPCDFGDIPYQVTIHKLADTAADTVRFEGTIQWTAINGNDAQEQLVYNVIK